MFRHASRGSIAFVVIDYEFSESYISEYGRIEVGN